MRAPLALAAAALAGGTTAWLAFAPVGFWPWLFLGLGVLAALLRGASGFGRGCLLGWVFGLAYFLVGVGWVRVSLHEFGGMPLPLAWFSALLFCAVLALYPALAGAITSALRPRAEAGFVVLFGAAWAFMEYLRAHLFTGFEWLGIAQSQTAPASLAGALPLVGGFGTAMLAACMAALMALAARRWLDKSRPRVQALLPLAIALGLWGIVALAGLIAYSSPSTAPTRVSLLQGNIEQSMKWEAAKFESTLALYERLVREAKGELIILPETALPAPLDRIDPAYLQRLRELAERKGASLLLGVPVREEGRFYNAAVPLGRGEGQQYRKVHLVPFGEFMPLRGLLGWFYANVTIPMSDFTPGKIDQPLMELAGQRLGISICYEDAFARDVHRTLPDASLLVNLSNDAWFGQSAAAAQHLQLAQMRSLEFARPMLRANNTGITAVIDARGRVIEELPSWQVGILEAEVQGHRGYTPYLMWGDLPALLVMLAVLAIALAQRLRQRGS